VISVRCEALLGQFVFPKLVLLKQGILAGDKTPGKRGFRVYPPWDKTGNRQAQNTQAWQLEYFLDMTNGLDAEKAKRLYRVLQ
jgi:hypothetical protein